MAATMAACMQALSIDAVLLDYLSRASAIGQVHSVFRRVINVICPGNQLICLASRELDDAPWTIRVDVRDWSRIPVEAGETVEFRTHSLSITARKSALIKLDGAQEWHAKQILISELLPDHVAARAQLLHQLVDVLGVRGGMLEPRGRVTAFEGAVSAALHQGRDGLVRAVVAGDEAGLHLAILQLLGLGPGLTPAGDDFLTGIALVAAQPGSTLAGLSRVLRHVLDEQPRRTNLLSYTTLREAVSGRARASLLDLMHVLLVTDGADAELVEQIRGLVDRVLCIGHTSGTDILSGLQVGLHLESELRGSM